MTKSLLKSSIQNQWKLWRDYRNLPKMNMRLIFHIFTVKMSKSWNYFQEWFTIIIVEHWNLKWRKRLDRQCQFYKITTNLLSSMLIKSSIEPVQQWPFKKHGEDISVTNARNRVSTWRWRKTEQLFIFKDSSGIRFIDIDNFFLKS